MSELTTESKAQSGLLNRLVDGVEESNAQSGLFSIARPALAGRSRSVTDPDLVAFDGDQGGNKNLGNK